MAPPAPETQQPQFEQQTMQLPSENANATVEQPYKSEAPMTAEPKMSLRGGGVIGDWYTLLLLPGSLPNLSDQKSDEETHLVSMPLSASSAARAAANAAVEQPLEGM